MEIVGTATKVTVYIGESDRWAGKPLHMAILDVLKAADCAGATVTRGIAGFGSHSRIRTASIVDLSADLPLIVEWVDDPARVERVMPKIKEMVAEGMITTQQVEVVAYGHRELRALPAAAPVRDRIEPRGPLGEARHERGGRSRDVNRQGVQVAARGGR